MILFHPEHAETPEFKSKNAGHEFLTTKKHETSKNILPRFILKTMLTDRLGVLNPSSKRNH